MSLWDKDLISQLSVVRIVNQGEDIPECVHDEVAYLHELGVKASVNIAYVMRKPFSVVSDMYDTALKFNPDIVYCADSSGSALPCQISEIIHLLKAKRRENMVGMHLHDHMSFAMANAVLAHSEHIDFTDFSVTGDGKGGGNLKTEMFLPLKRILDEKKITDDLFYGILDYVKFYERLIGRKSDVNVINYLNSLGGIFRFKSALMEKIQKLAAGDEKEFIRLVLENARVDNKLVYSNGKCAFE
jgi:4-hydroxy 2-oxovalerate aldolase